MADSASINQQLLSRFTEVCQLLLPAGKVQGNHYLVGGLDNKPGESLQITLSGAAAGRYKDFANPEDKGGTPLYLWSKSKGISFKKAVEEAKEFLGIKDEDYGIKKHKSKEWLPPAPADRNGVRLTEPNTKVMDYLTIERRLDPIVLAKARVGESKDGEWIVLPYFDPGEKDAFHIKKMMVDRPNGKKEIKASTGTKRSLYGKHLIEDNASEITITEGEIDALSLHSWSLPAVSVPNGVSDFTWVELDWEWLERFERINVAMDMDEQGRIAAKEICTKLGLHRCYIVTLPKKDANQCLVEGVTRDEIIKCLETAKAIELDEIKHPDEYIDEVHDYYSVDWSQRGWSTPWYPTLPWRVRKAEFTILSGFSGSGKALSIFTPIATTEGWTVMANLKVGDKVFDEKGKPCNVVFATEIQHDRKCYNVDFSDGASITADADHLWETWSPHARNSAARQKRGDLRPRKTNRKNPQKHKLAMPTVVNTETIAASIYETKWKDGKHLRHAVPMAKALNLPNANLPLDPYCLGAWLGDGNSNGQGFTCGRGDEQILTYFYEAGFPVSERLTREDKTPIYGILGLAAALRPLGVLDMKHIPSEYLRASKAQRLALLQGLMDTDGYCSDNGYCEFVTMRNDLANNVYELVTSLGIRTRISTGRASVNGKDCGTKYRILFTPSIPVFRLDRKLSKINVVAEDSRRLYRYITAVTPVPSVPVKCIQVDSPSHLYLCGIEMIPTHNTVALNQLLLHLVQQGCKVMDASLEIKPGMTLYNMTRCALGKKQSSRAEIEGCINWLNDSVYFLDCIGTVNTKRLMSAMEYARKRHGIDVFVIDSLFKCGLDPNDYGAQREFADLLTTFCNNTGAHVILVAHSRKTMNGNELSVPSKSDISGSSDLANAAFNVIIWWRNKMKKLKLDEERQKQMPDLEAVKKWTDQPDGAAVLDKQRFGEGEEARVNVFFDAHSFQFHTQQGKKLPYYMIR